MNEPDELEEPLPLETLKAIYKARERLRMPNIELFEVELEDYVIKASGGRINAAKRGQGQRSTGHERG